MKDKGTLGTIILIVVAIVILVAIYAWGRTEKKENTESEQVQSTEEQTQESGDAGKIGPNETTITAKNFDAEVINGSKGKLVVVDAYAPWCPHCQKMGPIVTALADEYVGKAKFGKMNADNQDSNQKENFDFAVAKGLDGYPTFWFYKDGKIVTSFSGEKEKADLKAEIEKYL
jgi:thioredoxin-like negative regulator of GroEL